MSETSQNYPTHDAPSSQTRSEASKRREAPEPTTPRGAPITTTGPRRRNHPAPSRAAQHLPPCQQSRRQNSPFRLPCQTHRRRRTVLSSGTLTSSVAMTCKLTHGPGQGEAAPALVSTRISERAAPKRGFGARRAPERAHCAPRRLKGLGGCEGGQCLISLPWPLSCLQRDTSRTGGSRSATTLARVLSDLRSALTPSRAAGRSYGGSW